MFLIKRRLSKIFFGWWTVVALGIASGLAHALQTFGFSVLFKPLAADLGLTRAVTSVAGGIGRLESGLEAPLVGWLLDKFGPRWLTIIGTCIMAIGLALMYFVNSVWSYYLVWGVLVGFGLNLGLTLPVNKAITDWFIRQRGIALSLRVVITGTLSVIALPIISWLVATQGWRITNVIWAGILLASVPLLWLFVKQKRPEYYGLLPDGAAVTEGTTDINQMLEKGVEYAAAAEEIEFTLRQALRTPAYWMLLISLSSGMMTTSAINIHLVPFLTDRGIDPIVAGSMMAMMIFFQIPSRFLGGFWGDRVSKDHLRFLLAGSFVSMTAGITAFLLYPNIATVYVLLILFGFGTGSTLPLRYVMGGRFFGRKAFGSIMGSMSLLEAPLAMVAPIFAGWIYDTTASYKIAFIVFAALGIVAAFFMLLARPPKPPAEVTEIGKFM